MTTFVSSVSWTLNQALWRGGETQDYLWRKFNKKCASQSDAKVSLFQKYVLHNLSRDFSRTITADPITCH